MKASRLLGSAPAVGLPQFTTGRISRRCSAHGRQMESVAGGIRNADNATYQCSLMRARRSDKVGRTARAGGFITCFKYEQDMRMRDVTL